MSIIEPDYLHIKIVSIEDVINYSLFLCTWKHKGEWEGKHPKTAYFPYFKNKLNLNLIYINITSFV